MHDEMKTEAMEVCATACEKFANNNEVSLSATENKLRKNKSVLFFCHFF